jgi:hypothetical protein
MEYKIKYTIDIPCYISEAWPKSETSKLNKFVRDGLNLVFGAGTTRGKISDYIETGKDTIIGSMSYDYVELQKNNYQLCDGDILPEWIYFCLKLCEGIQKLAYEDNLLTAFLVPDEKKMYEGIMVHDFCSYIGDDLWSMTEYGVFLLWGVERSCFLKKGRYSVPVQCRGGIYPISDGCGIGWCLNVEDGKRIGIPIEALKECS